MQTTDHVLMVRPANFGRASETVANNSFQEAVSNETFDEIGARARAEFDHFVGLLRSVGIRVTVVEDESEPVRPDAVFPNNWFSTHADGTLVLYPVYWPQRRRERRDDIIQFLLDRPAGARLLDLTEWEADERFLESTGSVVLDRTARIAYAALSQRCTRRAVYDWCERMVYRPITFRALDARGRVVYHTNVMMAVGSRYALVCLDAVTDAGERAVLADSLLTSGKEIVALTQVQMDQFAGNALELQSPDGPVWVMSSAAFASLTEAQRQRLVAHDGTRIVHADLSTIERYGGGSARCMLAELH